jgi:hypothetical protein
MCFLEQKCQMVISCYYFVLSKVSFIYVSQIFQSVMCSRLGGKSVMLGMVGNDDNGKAYVENFKVTSQ